MSTHTYLVDHPLPTILGLHDRLKGLTHRIIFMCYNLDGGNSSRRPSLVDICWLRSITYLFGCHVDYVCCSEVSRIKFQHCSNTSSIAEPQRGSPLPTPNAKSKVRIVHSCQLLLLYTIVLYCSIVYKYSLPKFMHRCQANHYVSII